MSEFHRFNLKTHADLQAALAAHALTLPLSENLSVLGERVALGTRVLANRFVVQPMEGVDGDPATGSPTELTHRRYRRFAAGGSALIWAESVAVAPDGASGMRQLRVSRDNLDGYKRLVEMVRQSASAECGHEVALVVQLTHSGRYSRPGGVPAPVKAQNIPELDDALGMRDLAPVSDDALMRLQDRFVDAAVLLSEAGFDGIDMKAVHGYLAAELLGARLRPGRFGGSYGNRTRFFRECVQRIAGAIPRDRFVTTRCSVLEPSPYPYGWGVRHGGSADGEEGATGDWEGDLSEPLALLRECAALGMPLLNVSLGYPRFQPYMNRPHDNALAGAPPPPEYPLEGVVRFQRAVRAVQRAIPGVPVVTAGLAWLRHLMPQVAAGLVEAGWCGLVGQGRNAFAYPESVKNILNLGLIDPHKWCITCSLCSQIMKDGLGCTGCVVRDKGVYAAEFLKGRSSRR